MLKKIILVQLVLSCCILFNVVAQTTTKKDSSTVIIFNQGTSKSSTFSRGSSETHVIKVEPFGFIGGKIPVSYERKITDLISVQVTAGITMKNYVRSAILGNINGSESDLGGEVTFTDPKIPAGFSDSAEPLYNYDTRKANIGYMFSLQPRVHFNNDGLEGSFLALSADFFRYNFSTLGLVQTSGGYESKGAPKKEYENIRDIMVNFGYQTLYDRISLEYSVGAGIRSVNGVKYIAGSSDRGFYESESAYTKKAGINVGFNFKVGYHF